MNALAQQLLATFEMLPIALQQEALHYVDYLKATVANRTEPIAATSPPQTNQSGSLMAVIRCHIDPIGGIEIALPPREATRQPIDFDS